MTEIPIVNSAAPQRDWLLTGARVLIYIAMAALIFGIVMLGIGTGVILSVGKARVLAEFAKAGAPASGFWMLPVSFLLIMVMLGFASKFLGKLLEIVNSVGQGDPFEPANADRLEAMAWYGVAGQLLALPLVGIAAWFAPYLKHIGRHSDFGFGLDLGTILLIVILFILARVFRKGTEMRAELEGTV